MSSCRHEVCRLTVILCKDMQADLLHIAGVERYGHQLPAAVVCCATCGRARGVQTVSWAGLTLLPLPFCLPQSAFLHRPRGPKCKLTCALVQASPHNSHMFGCHFAGMDDLSGVSLAALVRLYRFIDNCSACLQLHAEAQEAKEEAAVLQQVAAAAASAREREGELRKSLAEKEQ